MDPPVLTIGPCSIASYLIPPFQEGFLGFSLEAGWSEGEAREASRLLMASSKSSLVVESFFGTHLCLLTIA